MSDVLDHDQMEFLTRELKSKSDKIRKLAEADVSRADIARFLGVRYQYVRNVLIRTSSVSKLSSGSRRRGKVDDRTSIKVKLGAQGQVVIPAPFRERLGLKEGQTLFAMMDNGEIHLLPVSAAVRRAQEMVRKFVPDGVSLVDELLDDRRREVARESRDG